MTCVFELGETYWITNEHGDLVRGELVSALRDYLYFDIAQNRENHYIVSPLDTAIQIHSSWESAVAHLTPKPKPTKAKMFVVGRMYYRLDKTYRYVGKEFMPNGDVVFVFLETSGSFYKTSTPFFFEKLTDSILYWYLKLKEDGLHVEDLVKDAKTISNI